MSQSNQPRAFVLDRLRGELVDGPIVVAHRGDSRHCPENTLAAFRAARAAGVAMQEFDVQRTRDGVLVCLHDADLDRTTDAATVLGPGALVGQTTWAELQRLDAGSWHSPQHRGERIPRLADALPAMLPACVPVIEQKSGSAADYVAELQRLGVLEHCILQSFDWQFVAAARALAPSLALALLGPLRASEPLATSALTAAHDCGAGMVHWHAASLTSRAIAAAHAANLWVCSYTTDDELGWAGGAALGIDAMCTNDPVPMLQLRHTGALRRKS
jgi:glycerophosphoryl diester phosphodiesterase